MPGAAREATTGDTDLEMRTACTTTSSAADGAQRDVGLGDLGHGDRRLDARGHPGLLDEVLQRQGVHDGAEHAHVVGAVAGHAPLGELGAAEEVAPADDDGHLHPGEHRLGDLAGGVGDDVGVQAHRAPAEHLSGELQQDAARGGRGLGGRRLNGHK